jgi:hypothetical protein
MPLWLRLVNLWCRDRCPWGASACGRLPRTGLLEPLRARQCGRRQRPALSCSHQRKPSVTPAGNSLHTSPLPWAFGAVGGWPHGRSRAWGNCVFPSYGLARLGARVGHVFVATSLKATVPSPGFAGAYRRRPRTSFPRVTVSSGRLAQLCFRQAVLPRLAPCAGRQAFGLPHPGTPAVRTPQAVSHPSRSAGAGSAAVRTASAGPVASRCAPNGASTRADRALQHAAAR